MRASIVVRAFVGACLLMVAAVTTVVTVEPVNTSAGAYQVTGADLFDELIVCSDFSSAQAGCDIQISSTIPQIAALAAIIGLIALVYSGLVSNIPLATAGTVLLVLGVFVFYFFLTRALEPTVLLSAGWLQLMILGVLIIMLEAQTVFLKDTGPRHVANTPRR